MLDELEVPRLANGVRLQWDGVRDRHVLLFPEGALALNPTAAAVIELCDGERSVGEIVAELSARYDGADVDADVRELLARVAERKLIVDAGA